MRRMIPQKFSDWIKNIKDKLFVNNDGDIEIDGDLVVTGSVDSGTKLYRHTVYIERKGEGVCFFNGYIQIFNNESAALTATKVYNETNKAGFFSYIHAGFQEQSGGATQPSSDSSRAVSLKKGATDHAVILTILDGNNRETNSTINWTLAQISVTEVECIAMN